MLSSRFKKRFSSAIIIFIAIITIIGLSDLAFLTPRPEPEPETREEVAPTPLRYPLPMQNTTLTTADNKKISARILKADENIYPENKGWAVFLHSMPSTKESWEETMREFFEEGYSSVAIDFRGHGQSDGGPDGYEKLTEKEHQDKIKDLEAVIKYLLENTDATPDKISLVGASIGANVALQYASQHPEFKNIILLSAGLDYRGIQTESMIKKLRPGQKIMLITSKDDADNSIQNEKLYSLIGQGVKKEFKIYDSAGHGTTMTERQPELNTLIVEFVNE